MKVIVVGMGIQGKKRKAIAATDCVATVDPVADGVDYRSVRDVPLDSYEAALVCTPDGHKLDVLEYLLSNGKHVMVEKPLIADNDEALGHIRNLARENNVCCYTAYNHRFEPNIMRLKEVIDSGEIGTVYQAKFFYGNGTAADVKRSVWRDQGLGVLPDLASHLLDMTDYILGYRPENLSLWAGNRFENRAFDHVVLGSPGRIFIQYEMTLLCWKNSFFADIVGEKGSAHMACLCKWGPSSLAVRKRIFPSGRPTEKVHTVESPDPTWATEYTEFQRLCAECYCGVEKDIWINGVFNGFADQLREGKWAA